MNGVGEEEEEEEEGCVAKKEKRKKFKQPSPNKTKQNKLARQLTHLTSHSLTFN